MGLLVLVGRLVEYRPGGPMLPSLNPRFEERSADSVCNYWVQVSHGAV